MRVYKVECYAGYRGEEEPRRFLLGERWVEVQEVVDRWLAPDHRYFKLHGDDGDIYVLRQDVPAGLWELTLYEQGPRANAPRGAAPGAGHS